MRRRHWLSTLAAIAAGSALALSSLSAFGGTIKLKDGTVIEGEVRKLGGSYSVRTPDGKTQMIPAANIAEIDGQPIGGAAATPADAGGTAGGTTAGASSSFAGTKSKADRYEEAVLAITLWEQWIAANPKSPDLTAAKAELDLWKQRQKDGAVRIKGKWLSGDELKAFQKKIEQLMTEAIDQQDGRVRGVVGVNKLKEIVALYPNNFEANFELGFYYLDQAKLKIGFNQNVDLSIKSLEAASKIRPDIPEVWSNLAIAYNFRNRYEESVNAAWTAVKANPDPSKELVQTLANALFLAPRGLLQNNARVRGIAEEAQVLFRKHGVQGAAGGWLFLRPSPQAVAEGGATGKEAKRAGVQWAGSGFFITADGYLITNHHVATGEPDKPIQPDIFFRVRLDDGKEHLAELIAVDDKADIALMKVKPEEGQPFSFLHVAADNPPQGDDALVLGYPATGERDSGMQISSGSVKSINPGNEHEVWFDLNTTHGNSGGPIVDRECNVISILTGGRQSYNMTIVLGVGPNQIERFLGTLGEKAPKLDYVSRSQNPPAFDRVKLTEQARKATMQIFAVRGEAGETPPAGARNKGGLIGGGAGKAKPDEKPPAPTPPPAEGGDRGTPGKGGNAPPAEAPAAD
jgi:S1-C subfamily serine protease